MKLNNERVRLQLDEPLHPVRKLPRVEAEQVLELADPLHRAHGLRQVRPVLARQLRALQRRWGWPVAEVGDAVEDQQARRRAVQRELADEGHVVGAVGTQHAHGVRKVEHVVRVAVHKGRVVDLHQREEVRVRAEPHPLRFTVHLPRQPRQQPLHLALREPVHQQRAAQLVDAGKKLQANLGRQHRERARQAGALRLRQGGGDLLSQLCRRVHHCRWGVAPP